MGPSDDREGRRAQLSFPDVFDTNALYAPDFWDRLMALYELDVLSEIFALTHMLMLQMDAGPTYLKALCCQIWLSFAFVNACVREVT